MEMANCEGLKDRVCVVTGAAGGLCSAMAEALCEAGAKVALLGRTETKLLSLARLLQQKGYSNTLPIQADVLVREDLENAREIIRERFGLTYLLLNGAGGNHPRAVTQVEMLQGNTEKELAEGFFGLDLEAFDAVFDLNFKGSLLSCLVFAEDMARAGIGCIINISSMSAQLPMTRAPAYAAAKASIDNFTRWLAVHFSKSNIRVNAIAPGFFSTAQNRFLLYEKDGKALTARGRRILSQTPMGEFGRPEDLKGAVRYLASPELARFVTGIVLPVDGGFSAFSGV
ncbi:MAG: SDR family oxidoreductase [Deltaproteobacteria bacterium]|nr:SDR family oxidoreductase [Deltaproteobacteria bacterium]MBW2150168.1 SDR family oxidoreductase [Deltaproteobacteria bacterium]